jgi:hypothetical protein
MDDLPPHTIRLLALLDGLVKERSATTPTKHVRLTRREIREALGLGDTQLWTHLRRLAEAEYVVVHPSGRGRGLVYELAFGGLGPAPSEARKSPEFGPNPRRIETEAERATDDARHAEEDGR